VRGMAGQVGCRFVAIVSRQNGGGRGVGRSTGQGIGDAKSKKRGGEHRVVPTLPLIFRKAVQLGVGDRPSQGWLGQKIDVGPS